MLAVTAVQHGHKCTTRPSFPHLCQALVSTLVAPVHPYFLCHPEPGMRLGTSWAESPPQNRLLGALQDSVAGQELAPFPGQLASSSPHPGSSCEPLQKVSCRRQRVSPEGRGCVAPRNGQSRHRGLGDPNSIPGARKPGPACLRMQRAGHHWSGFADRSPRSKSLCILHPKSHIAQGLARCWGRENVSELRSRNPASI